MGGSQRCQKSEGGFTSTKSGEQDHSIHRQHRSILLQITYGKKCVSSSNTTWRPPPEGLICINVDAALFTADHRMGWAMVARDHSGSVLFAARGGVAGSFSPEMAESML